MIRPLLHCAMAVLGAAIALLPHATRADDAGDLRSPSRIDVVESPATPPAGATAATPTEPTDSGGRIFNGVRAAPGSAAWQAEIYREISDTRWAQHLRDHPAEKRAKWELQHWCGGALVAEFWVLTAAHCILVDEAISDPLLKTGFAQQRPAVTVSKARQVTLAQCVSARLVIDSFRVRLGANDVSAGDGITFRIDCAVVHPGWKSDDMFHDDIALVHFVADGPPPPRDPKRVRAIRLFDDPVIADGTPVTITGWGKTKPVEGFAPSALLMKVELGVEGEAACARELGAAPGQIHAGVLCAGAPDRKTCLGDSGGPVVFSGGPPTMLVGVVSWGAAACAGDARPGVYTRVAAYLPWIEDVLSAPP